MAASQDTSFVDLLKTRIQQKCINYGPFGCLLWQGARWGKSPYGKLAVTMPGSGRRMYFRVHRLAYYLYNYFNPLQTESENILDFSLPSHDETGHIIEVSHICHNALCTNPQHLVLELHSTNMERIHCSKQGICTHPHSPYCLI